MMFDLILKMKMNMKIEQETTYRYSFDTAKDDEQLTIDVNLKRRKRSKKFPL